MLGCGSVVAHPAFPLRPLFLLGRMIVHATPGAKTRRGNSRVVLFSRPSPGVAYERTAVPSASLMPSDPVIPEGAWLRKPEIPGSTG